ncbi:MAG: hypothetical protein ACYTFI_18465, partial [Planctomycetota bacterium]
MGQAEPHDLVVTAADRLWTFRVDRPEVRDHLAEWLGPWARGPARGDGPAAGSISMVTVEPAEDTPRVRCTTPRGEVLLREPDATRDASRIPTEPYEILVTAAHGHEHAVVRCEAGYHNTAARTALRILVSRLVVTEGGLALHASSVRTPRGVLVFAGPSGAGKTSASEAFPAGERLDSDLVLLAEKDGRWVRLDFFDEYEPRRFAPGVARDLSLRAVLMPEAAAGFAIRFLGGVEAVRACLHLPAAAAASQGGSSPDAVSNVLA